MNVPTFVCISFDEMYYYNPHISPQRFLQQPTQPLEFFHSHPNVETPQRPPVIRDDYMCGALNMSHAKKKSS